MKKLVAYGLIMFLCWVYYQKTEEAKQHAVAPTAPIDVQIEEGLEIPENIKLDAAPAVEQ